VIGSEQLFTNRKPGSNAARLIRFPLVRIILAALFIVPFLLVHNNVVGDVIAATSEPLHSVLVNIDVVVSIVVMLFLYRLYVGLVEKREAYELSTHGALIEFGWGSLLSLSIVAAMVILLSVLHHYQIVGIGNGGVLLNALFFFSIGAFVQVLAFRIILLRLTEELFGSWIAIGAIALVFGLAHLGNENATLWTSLGMTLSDLPYSAAFVLTRRLWLVWGFHASWNFFQDGMFGMANSGIESLLSWITADVTGPIWLTGGSFGVEASYLVVAVHLALGVVLITMAKKRGQIVAPTWRRTTQQHHMPQ
jgi:membrane protease YdiL (CAAX protease family)